MGLLTAVATLVVVGTFCLAAVGKLRHRATFRAAVASFGVPTQFVAVVAPAVPAAELAAAVLLVVPGTLRLGAGLSLGLLATFSGGALLARTRGHTPSCACFGQARATPVDARTMLRNGLLAALTGPALLSSSGSLRAHLTGVTAVQVLGLAVALSLTAVAVLVGVLVAVLRRHGRTLERLDAWEKGAADAAAAPGAQPAAGLALGAPAPDLPVPRRRGVATVVVFLDRDCGSCRELAPVVAAWPGQHGATFGTVVVTPQQGWFPAPEPGVAAPAVVHDDGDVLRAAFECPGTPGAVVVDPDGRIGSDLVLGPEAVRTLVAGLTPPAVRSSRPATVPHFGGRLPELGLVDAAGEPVRVEALLRGTGPALMLFWDDDCGFCRDLSQQLTETLARPDLPDVVLVSRSGASPSWPHLAAPRDPAGTAMRALAVPGTPAAILVDAAGTLRSTVVAGGPAVLDLLTSRGSEVLAGR